MQNPRLEEIIKNLSDPELAALAERRGNMDAGEESERIGATIKKMAERFGPFIDEILAQRKITEVLDGEGAENLTASMRTYLSPHGFRITAATDTGVHRERNEDRAVIDTGNEFYAVIDGMGGHNDGDKAAELTAHALLKYPRSIDLAVLEAIVRFKEAGLSEESGVCFHAVQFHMNNKGQFTMDAGQMGDVRLVALDQHYAVVYESHDQNLVDELVRQGCIKPDDALYHRLRSHVSNALSRNNTGYKVDKTASALPVHSGYKVLLMSDSFTDNLTTDELLKEIKGLNGENIVRTGNDLLQDRMQRYKEIKEQTKDRRTEGKYCDGYKSEPKPDNRAIIVIEIP